MKYHLLLIVLLVFLSCNQEKHDSYQKKENNATAAIEVGKPKLQTGDIIFQTSTSTQSQAIQLATHSKYSHIGILFFLENQWMVLEAVQPVKFTPITSWIARGQNKHYVIKQLKNRELYLQKQQEDEMLEWAKQQLNKNYDLYFEWSDDRMYCSELVWKMFNQVLDINLGDLQQLEEFDLSANAVKVKLKERYGQQIPLKEQVISPAAIFNSILLEDVYSSTF